MKLRDTLGKLFDQFLVSQRVLLFLLLLCLSTSSALAQNERKADLSNLVVIGDSLAAGFQNGSLLDVQQNKGFASLIAAQAQVPLPLPLIAYPGIPNVITNVSLGPPPIIQMAPGVSTGRTNPLVQPKNLAVPGATVQDALTTRPTCIPGSPTITDLVLGLPAPCLGLGLPLSQVEWAEALHPTTVIVWLGSEDALKAVFSGTSAALTPPSSFATAYAEVMVRLAGTGAKLVAANVPDVTDIPYLTSAPVAANLFGVPPQEFQLFLFMLGIGPADLLTPDALALIGPILLNQIPGPLPSNVVLDATEILAIRSATQAYNEIIANQAAAHGAALVDVAALYNSINAKGVVVGGQRLTADLFGGIFSLDGIHPTNTGFAIIANEFIKAMNTSFAAGIPPLPVRQVQKDDPLVFPGGGHPASALGVITPKIVQSLRSVLQ
jgi:phospholipase/lecithinase/hemolysin